MKLESSYIRTVTLGATRGGGVLVTRGGGDLGHTRGALGAVPEDFKWKDGICYNIKTGVPYTGNQADSNCYTLHGPYKAPTGGSAVYDFFKKTLLGGGYQQGQMPQASITSSSLLVPAVVVVGGLALFLILRKKK